jgi:hypothetical protein
MVKVGDIVAVKVRVIERFGVGVFVGVGGLRMNIRAPSAATSGPL